MSNTESFIPREKIVKIANIFTIALGTISLLAHQHPAAVVASVVAIVIGVILLVRLKRSTTSITPDTIFYNLLPPIAVFTILVGRFLSSDQGAILVVLPSILVLAVMYKIKGMPKYVRHKNNLRRL